MKGEEAFVVGLDGADWHFDFVGFATIKVELTRDTPSACERNSCRDLAGQDTDRQLPESQNRNAPPLYYGAVWRSGTNCLHRSA